jgi:hypothetical protein
VFQLDGIAFHPQLTVAEKDKKESQVVIKELSIIFYLQMVLSLVSAFLCCHVWKL